MWKLTVEREYTEGSEYKFRETDRMYFESDDLEELQILINYFDTLGTGGKFSYIIERKEEKE